MKPATTIRLLTTTTNQKGDLFTRLMKDLFYALSYEDIRLDVHKTGREIDIQGRHRHEARLLRAECKAHEAKMGGAELNKFFGALSRERKKRKKTDEPIEGYFISLGGFTETGIDQELETGNDRIILLGPTQIIRQLEQSRVLVDDTVVAEKAGQCASRVGVGNAIASSIELLGHEMGYVKVVYYELNKQLTHFALIHADGSPLAVSPAQIIIDTDQASGGVLHQLKYLAPAPAERRVAEADVMAHYRKWLSEECGYIYMDGLPTVSDASTTRLELERLFVPLRAILSPAQEHDDGIEFRIKSESIKPDSRSIGELLTSSAHLALLAAPGGGKSTLLKRLAMFYAFDDRASSIADHLPKRDWLPLFLRCRELRNRATQPILSLLEQLPIQANMPLEESVVFRQIIHEALRGGKILLLVDGLDEIGEEGDRKVFANNLRTFLAMFPQTTMVVTSREAGFRLVAGVIASVCRHARLAPFEQQDVSRLCEQWHVQVVKDTDEVRRKALELAKEIWENERIRELAVNPLLLTTLLVVNRWIGEVPKSRATLYGKAVEVLVRTWNSEGFKPLDEDETLAQLSYLACVMMERGDQQVTRSMLLQILNEARKTLTAELRFTKITAAEFVKRVEYRSSLLMQTGTSLIDGELQDVYEFRHLTFQEYLAARGYIEGHHPKGNDGFTLEELIIPYCQDPRWSEVVLLTLSLAKRHAQPIVQGLIDMCIDMDVDAQYEEYETPRKILCQCVLDEVTVTSPDTLDVLLKFAYINGVEFSLVNNYVKKMLKGRFGDLFKTIVENEFINSDDWTGNQTTLMEIYFHEICEEFNYEPKLIVDKVISLILCGIRTEQIRGLFVLTQCGFYFGLENEDSFLNKWSDLTKGNFKVEEKLIKNVYEQIGVFLLSNDEQLIFTASWAMVWGPSLLGYELLSGTSLIQKSLALWCQINLLHIKANGYTIKFAAWAMNRLPVLERDAILNNSFNAYFDQYTIDSFMSSEDSISETAVFVAWYRLVDCSDEKLVYIIDKCYPVERNARMKVENEKVVLYLNSLGSNGKNMLAARDKLRELLLKELGPPFPIGDDFGNDPPF